MEKITFGLLTFICLGAMSFLFLNGAGAYKADCCSDASKCCTQSCCEDHK